VIAADSQIFYFLIMGEYKQLVCHQLIFIKL